MFFIVGSARSGTTLLRLILNAHPQVAVPPESRFITELWTGREEVEVDDFLTSLGEHRLFRVWNITIDEVRRELGDAQRVPYPDAVEAAYRAWARAKHKDCWGDKTPRYIENIPLLAKLWPEAKFVHQIRDGRNVVLSYADVPFGPKTLGKAADLWAKRVTAGLTEGRKLGPERYLEIRYEEFVANPASQAKTLCDFLGIDFDPDMLDYAEKARTDILPRAARYNPHVAEPPKASLRAWEDQMPERDVAMFEAIAGDVLSMLEYPRRFPEPSAKTRAMAALSRAGLPVARLHRHKH